MINLRFSNGEIIQEENEFPIGLIILKKGDLLCESSFCNYKKIHINKGVFAEEFLFDKRSNELLKNIRKTEITILDNIAEADKFLSQNTNLLKLAIEKRINMLINMNEKISSNFIKNENSKKLSSEKSKKFFKSIYRYNWHHFNADFIQKYISARELILEKEYEEALDILNKIILNNVKDDYFKAEIDIWKIYCVYHLNPDKAHELFDKVRYKYNFLDSLISFKILHNLFNKKKLDTIYNSYFKKGYVIPAKTVLFFEGEEGDWSFLILKGSIFVSKFLNEKTEVLLNILTEGEIVGEIAILKKVKRTATVFSKASTQIILIDSDNFESLINESYLLGKNILKALIYRVDFQKELIQKRTLKEKIKFLINKYSIERLNELHLTPIQFINLFGSEIDMNNFLSEINSNKIAALRPDGTLNFKS
ncbi:MAG: hypothetical protein B6I29_00750 [Marinitoga sp. 4572_148]|nr:MAG: hypothetical protein B6I29_00750 [Marinitoga sp. 4572_148]